jgi:hypothetical protein
MLDPDPLKVNADPKHWKEECKIKFSLFLMLTVPGAGLRNTGSVEAQFHKDNRTSIPKIMIANLIQKITGIILFRIPDLPLLLPIFKKLRCKHVIVTVNNCVPVTNFNRTRDPEKNLFRFRSDKKG